MYILKNENEIIAWSTSKNNDSYVWTDEEVVEVGGKMYLASDERIAQAKVDEAKAKKISELKGIRDTKEVEPVQTDKGLFDYDSKSRDRLAIARQALTDNGGGSIVWTTADNQRVEMGIADFAAINGAAAVRSNSLHIKYNELKERVNAAQTVEEVNSIQWTETL